MTTIQEVFDAAIMLMDEQSEVTGNTVTADTREYTYRTIPILNTVMPALYPYSDTYDTGGPGRPVCPKLKENTENRKEPDFTQELPIDDTLAMGVLTYALAQHLTATENEELSAVFRRLYMDAFLDIRNKIPGEFEPISTPYGLF